ncbi:MAG TPA: MauE/DoxX family redox-associated membrane protein [Ktedonobacteraceae bacterium]|jgi:uncharacterized membrane protein YphA (DoxX/SURF4 family)|nr:MauE/DoxX family redox-associated membrane protein [Ktedonobacteraceae bacterium]
MFSTVIACYSLLGIIFLRSGIGKMFFWDSLPDTIAEYQLLPKSLVKPVAYILPFVELFSGIWLFTGMNLLFAAGLATILLFVFTIAIAINLARGRRIQCHCFGKAG